MSAFPSMSLFSRLVVSQRFKYFFLVVVFLFFRVPFLTKMPVFNDESIYIDWAWRAVNSPGFMFFSLLDGKQPVVLWVMGLLETVLPNMLWAGRFAAVVFSALAMAGVYRATNLIYVDRKLAMYAALLYCILPPFVFFDRQALYESAVSTVFIWLLVATASFIKGPNLLKSIALGTVLGLGIWIKTTTLLLVPAVLVGLWVGLGKKMLQRENLGFIAYAFFVSQAFAVLLYVQPTFQQGASLNRYIFSLTELIHFPVWTWFSNAWLAVETFWWLCTPGIVMVVFWWSYTILRKNTKDKNSIRTLPLWYFVTIVVELVILSQAMTPRYMVAPLSVIPILAAASLSQLWQKSVAAKAFVGFSVLCAVGMGLFGLVFPIQYLRSLDVVSRYSLAHEYLDLWTSGKAGQEAVAYVSTKIGSGSGMVFVRRDAGNPESLVTYSFHKQPMVTVAYFDAQDVRGLDQYDCISSQYPVFYISRDFHLVGTERFWQEVERFYNGVNSVGVYVPKTSCEGKILELH